MRGFSRSLSRAAAREAGTHPPIAGLKAITTGQGGSYKTVFTFNAMQVPVTSALKYASVAIFNNVKGKVRVKGGTAKLQFAVLTARGSTIINNAAMTWGLGSAAASATALATTMQNIIGTTGRTLNGAVDALSTASQVDVVATAFTLDGTVTPINEYLNFAFATGTDVLGNGTLAITGTITLLYEAWGDNG